METKKKYYRVIDASCTKYLPTPLVVGDILEAVEDDSISEKEIKVKHANGEVSKFLRNRFKRHLQNKA